MVTYDDFLQTCYDLADDPSGFGLKGSPTWVQEIMTVEIARDVQDTRDYFAAR